MTRETKVGLVVASSFLCLVGVVVASRLGRNVVTASPPNPPFVNNSQPPENPVDEKSDSKKPSADKKGEHNGAAQVNGNHGNPPLPMNPAVSNSEPLPPLSPVDFSALATGTAPTPQEPNHKGSQDKPTPAALKSAADKEFEDRLTEQKNKAGHANLDPSHDTTPPSTAFPVNSQGPAMLQPGQEAHKQDLPLPPPATPPSANIQEQNITPKQTPPPPPPPPAHNIDLPMPPGGDQKPSAASNNLPATGNPTPPPGKSESSAKDVTKPSLPPMGFDNKPPSNLPSMQSNSPTTNNLPKVNVLTPQTYLCKEEDTSFEALSTRFYNSPKYARALQQFNKENPMSRPNVLQDNPRLAVGQPVFLAPKEFLDSHFASLITSAPSPPAPQPQVPISINPPVASTVGGQATSLPTIGRQPVAVQSTDPTRKYRVPAQGQLLAEIAQQQLGDHRRWTEIYRLNSNLHPEVPVPGGTDILLPVAAP